MKSKDLITLYWKLWSYTKLNFIIYSSMKIYVGLKIALMSSEINDRFLISSIKIVIIRI